MTDVGYIALRCWLPLVRGCRAGIALALALAVGMPAHAHVTSTGLATLSVERESLTYTLNVIASELPEEGRRLLSAAADGDVPMAQALADAMRQAVSVEADGAVCRPGRVRIQGAQAGDSKVRLVLVLTCGNSPRQLTIREDWRALFGEHYQTILSISLIGGSQERVLGENGREATVTLASVADASGSLDFLRLGVEHILGGIDHLLFLVALLAYTRRFWNVVKIVTAFTVAHCITLSLAVLEVIDVPAQIVEPLIAASIVWVAVENLIWPGREWRRWLVSFCFGLVHGVGFAGALSELKLQGLALAKALVMFNAGVELGQIAFIAVFLPLLVWASRPPMLHRLPKAVSVVVAVAGSIWVVQRVFLT